MLIAKVAFPVAALLLASLASEARYHSRLSRVLRPRERRDKHRYFEQCHFVDVWKERLGHVSVLAFLDPAWQYSFRQAVMLELLSSRLRKSGFPDIRFFAISPFSDLTKNERSQDEIEIETWREIEARHEIESLVDGDFLSGNGSKITLLRDDSRSRIWERFRALRDQVIIIDRCGKLTYQVIVPWSILLFPYVKAAILSTYEEDPCGGCDPIIYRVSSHEDHVVSLKGTDEKKTSPQREVDANVGSSWTTERLENAAVHHNESFLEKEREVSTAFSISILPEELTNNTNHPNLSTESLTESTNDTDRPNLSMKSSTESTTYRYDSTKESRFDEDHPESTRDQEDLTNFKDGSTIPDGTTSTFESQRDIFSSEQTGSPSVNDNSFTSASYGNTTDRTLLLDEPAVGETDSTSADEETTTMTDFADEAQDRNTTLENAEHFGEDALPLRIIIYAPHIHKSGKKTKKYTHLLLRTDDPDFHGHLDSRVDVSSPTDSWQGANSRTSFEEYDWETTEANANEENANQKYTYDIDESPGLYGEVADYWKSYEDNDITDRNETYINDTYNNSTTSYNEEYHTNVSDHALISKPEESDSIVIKDPNVKSSTDPQNIVGSNTIESSRPINTNDQVDTKEEKRYELNKHYNKLLSWINYRLNK